PLFGPSNVRESLALPLDRCVSPLLLVNDSTTRWSLGALQVIKVRAGLLQAGRFIDGAGLDKYSFVRDAYLQRRRNLVFDGDPPDESPPPDPEDLGAGDDVSKRK
ncbi:MAG: MlaA family lipoprotein, partial [Burkholderiaceae bacterium]